MQVYSEKITRIVEDISSLNLLEVSKADEGLNLSTTSHLMYLRQVADLNSLLKSKLNISDAPVMMAGAAAPAPAAAAPVEVCCYAWYLTPAELCALLCLVFLSRNKHEQGATKEFIFYHKDRSILEISSGGRGTGSPSHPDVVYSEVEQI